MLLCLSHSTICCSNNDDSTIHLSSTCDHVLDVVSVTRAVHVSIVSVLGLILDVSCVDCDTTLLLFWCIVDCIISKGLVSEQLSAVHCDSCCECGLTMVNVTDGSYVYVWLSSLEFFLSHQFLLVALATNQKDIFYKGPSLYSLPETTDCQVIKLSSRGRQYD